MPWNLSRAIRRTSVTAPTPEPTGSAPQGNPQDQPKGAEADKPLGPAGEKALQTERDARKELEKEIQGLKAAQADLPKKLAEVFGIKTDGAKPEEAVATLQQQFARLQHDNLVLTVAAAHQITDQDDLDHLRLAADEEAMTKLAARLKPAEQQDGARRLPKPDPTQGKGGAPVKPGEAGKAEAARRFPQKTQ